MIGTLRPGLLSVVYNIGGAERMTKKYVVIKSFDIGLFKTIEKGVILFLKDNNFYLENELICHKTSVVGKNNIKQYRKDVKEKYNIV